MDTKICMACHVCKPIDQYYQCGTKHYRRRKCRVCLGLESKSEQRKTARRANYRRNQEREKAASRAYYRSERGRQNRKRYHDNHRAEIAARVAARNQREDVKQRTKEGRRRRERDPRIRAIARLRNRLHKVLKGTVKIASTRDLLGCSLEDLKTHLQSLWQPGMSWDNYGKDGWHIDHIRPCISFDLTDPEQQRKCFHYSNMQPLWAIDNKRKGGRWVDTDGAPGVSSC